MSQNVFDNLVVLEATEGLIVFRDFATGTDALYFFFYPANPNGLVPAPRGSIASGPAGAFINVDGASGWAPISGGGGGGSLQDAYDFGPTGAIVTTLGNGPVSVTNPVGTAQTALVVVQDQPGEYAIDVTGPVRASSSVTALSLLLSDPLLGTSVYADFSDGQTSPLSAAGHGTLRYNDLTKTFQVSLDGGAYVNVATGAGGGGSLQDAYDFIPSGVINLSLAGGPLALTNPAATAQTALSVTQSTAGEYGLEVQGSGQALFQSGVNRWFEVNTLDSFAREQLWFTGTNGVLRLGADTANGDTFDADSEGIVIYNPGGGDLLGRMKADRFGLSRASDSSLYYFRVDETRLIYTANPAVGPVYGAGTVWLYADRATGFVDVGNLVTGAGFPTPYGLDIFRVQGDARVDGNLYDFRRAIDPSLTPAPTRYVRTTGNDLTGNGTLLNPFLTIGRAVQSLPVMPAYANTYPIIDVGPGTFSLPQEGDYGNITFQTTRTVTTTYTVDATSPANTAGTGSRIVFNTLDPALPVGTRLNFQGGQSAEVYYSDNSGAGGRLAVWVVTSDGTTMISPAAGTTADVLANAAVLELDDYTIIKGGYFVDIEFQPLGASALVIAEQVDFTRCDFGPDVSVFAWAAGVLMTLPFLQSAMINDNSVIEINGGVAVVGTLYPDAVLVTANTGTIDLQGEIAFVGPAVNTGTTYGIATQGGQIVNGPLAIYRIVQNVDTVVSVNQLAVNGTAFGGGFSIGDILQPQTLAGAQISGFSGSFLVDVGEQTNAQVRLGDGSNIVVLGVTNPVGVNGVARSTDTSGTRIQGGAPAPGPGGVSYRYSAVDTSWDPLTDDFLEMDTTAADRNANLPAANSVTPGCVAEIKKRGNKTNVSGFDLTVTPQVGDTIDGTAGALSYYAIGYGNYGCLRFRSDGISNWSRA